MVIADLSIFKNKSNKLYTCENHKGEHYSPFTSSIIREVGRFKFKNQEYLIVEESKDGLFGTIKTFDIHVFATDYKNLMHELFEEFEVLEQLYVVCDENELSSSAKELRRELLNNVTGWKTHDGIK